MIIGPRNGPNTIAHTRCSRSRTTAPPAKVWTRQLGHHHYLFWAWPDQLNVYRIPEDRHTQLVHTYRKEN